MTQNEEKELELLVNGLRPPKSGMEKHFIQVLAGDSRACTLVEKEWVRWVENNKELVKVKWVKKDKSPNHSLPITDTSSTNSNQSTKETKAKIVISESQDRLCIDCEKPIPEARLAVSPKSIRCVKCQFAYEKKHDTSPKINEGIAGTRDENKRMRAQIWGEIRKRNTGR